MEIGRRLTGWFGGLAGVRPRARGGVMGRSSRAAGSRKLVFGGSPVAVAVVVSLAAGFMAGRWSDAATSGAALQVSEGRVPGPLRSEASNKVLSFERELDQLSNHAYRVYAYPEAERSRASRLANWLVIQGVETARLRLMKRKDSSLMWVVVCYVPAAEDRAVFGKLKNLDAPSFEPELVGVLARLKEEPDPVGV